MSVHVTRINIDEQKVVKSVLIDSITNLISFSKYMDEHCEKSKNTQV